jgi:hypothetical protein
LIEAHNPYTDSPIYQLVEGFPDIQRIKTDLFRERVKYLEELKQQLVKIRRQKNISNLKNFVKIFKMQLQLSFINERKIITFEAPKNL